MSLCLDASLKHLLIAILIVVRVLFLTCFCHQYCCSCSVCEGYIDIYVHRNKCIYIFGVRHSNVISLLSVSQVKLQSELCLRSRLS